MKSKVQSSGDISREPTVMELIRRAVAEDVGPGDVTSEALVGLEVSVEAVVLARSPLVVCGVDVARAVFAEIDPEVRCVPTRLDGQRAGAQDILLTLTGRARSILTGERTALNFMQRLCGIATLTRQFVDRVASSGTRILDTRKTTPTLRVLEKYAVRCGGGENHRFGLFDRILIKDNHRRLAGLPGGMGLAAAVERARQLHPGLQVEVEVETLAELEEVLPANPDWILLDNMGTDLMARCVRRVAGQSAVEASGGITLERVSAVAGTGVDAISLGCLTHSAPAADLSLEILT